jgi:hypothetical protein
MSPTRDPRYDFTAALHSHLTCPLCGTRRDCPLTALVRYARRGWPRCCGEVMILTPDESAPGEPSGEAQPMPSGGL